MRHLVLTTSFSLLALAGLRPVSADLIWHSALDGDATANVGADGVANGAPTATMDLNGNADGAVLFNGTTDFFDIGNLGSFTAGSMSAWVRSDNNANERGAVAAGATGGGATVYFSFMNENGGRIRVDLDDGATRRDVLNNDVLNLGQWYHVATTWSAGGNLLIYMDGVQQTDIQSLAGNVSPYVMTLNGLIGSERTTERFWQGAIDDVRIYDHELSAGDVTALFNAGPQFNQIPEPSSIVLAVLGMTFGALLWRRCRRARG